VLKNITIFVFHISNFSLFFLILSFFNIASLFFKRLEIFEDKMVALEKGSNYASAFPSGMSAIATTMMSLIGQGGHIIYSSPVYGGTYFFLKASCPQLFGITTTPIDMSTTDLSKFQTMIGDLDRLDALFLETPVNPTLRMTDIAYVATMARTKFPNVIVMVDNTFLGPVFQSPFLHGADVVLYSATKFISGHSDLIAGVILTKSEDHINKINEYRTILGPTIAPDTCWMLTRSLETV
jgi:methionine-gamma-lyase